jgi:hypothetical protein
MAGRAVPRAPAWAKATGAQRASPGQVHAQGGEGCREFVLGHNALSARATRPALAVRKGIGQRTVTFKVLGMRRAQISTRLT